MLSISTPRSGAAAAIIYYLEGALDYYLHGLHKLGHWFGQGAEKLGLWGKVEAETFKNILNGFSSDGKRRLVQNAGSEDRDCYWDLTFSAPKSVGVLWAMAPKRIRQEIERAHDEAVQEALAYMEEVAGLTRRGKGGKLVEHCGLVFATFFEGASRDQDPQPHTHCVMANLGVRQDGTTGALKTNEIFDLKLAGGERYQLGFAARLHQWLGLAIEPDRVGFRIVGVPKDVCRAFSKRRQKIEQVMKARGLSGAIAANQVTLETRPRKQELPAAILLQSWQETGRSLGWGPEQAVALLEKVRQQKQEPLFETDKGTSVEQARTKPLPERNLDTLATNPSNRISQKKRSCAADKRREAAEANKKAFQAAIDRILAERYVPPRSAQEPNQEKTSAQTRSGEKQQDQAHEAGERVHPGAEKQEAHRDSSQHHGQQEERRSEQKQAQQNSSQEQAKAEQRRRNSEQARKAQKDAQIHEQKQQAANKQFVRVFLAMLDRMHPETQTRTRVTKLAWWLGHQLKADPATIKALLGEIVPGAERSFLHSEWPRLFPNASVPFLKAIRTEVLRLGNPPRRWTKTLWKANFFKAEFRIQMRRFFPSAPRWSPLYGHEFPAFRLTKKPASLVHAKPKQEQDKAREREREHEQGMTR